MQAGREFPSLLFARHHRSFHGNYRKQFQQSVSHGHGTFQESEYHDMYQAVFFDLDGTLLPMDNEYFVQVYFSQIAEFFHPHGYDKKKLIQGIGAGTMAMIENDGKQRNEDVFWSVFSQIMGPMIREAEPLFEEFYRTGFLKTREICGYNPVSRQVVDYLQARDIPLILATNPMFPPIATQQRIRWAGLEPEDFRWVTTYDNSRFCKPNLAYFQELLDQFGYDPNRCLMVGNDTGDDTPPRQLGMDVYLVTDHLINNNGTDLSDYPHGSMSDFFAWLQERC